jgi:glycosyltransferase involved in cell wall biosynthesis
LSSSQRIKVVHVITGLSTGGAETMLLKLLTRMSNNKFENIVVSLTSEGDLAKDIRALDIPVIALGMTRAQLGPGPFFQLVRHLRRIRPDIIQTWLYHADLVGFIAGRVSCRAKISWNLRCSFMGDEYYRGLSGLIIKFLAILSRFADSIVVNSRTGLELHQKLGYRSANWDLIPNGFDTETFVPNSNAKAQLHSEMDIPPDAPVIGLVGRYDPVKGHETFFLAAQELLMSHTNAHFLLAGGGCSFDNAELMTLIVDKVSPQVRLLGNRRDMPRVTAALDIANCVSIGEGFPNVVGEAMSCGVPCVVTDVGDCADIVGDCGKVVPVSNAPALAEAWRDILHLSSKEHALIQQNSRARIQNKYGLNTIVGQYEAHYENLFRQRTRENS